MRRSDVVPAVTDDQSERHFLDAAEMPIQSLVGRRGVNFHPVMNLERAFFEVWFSREFWAPIGPA